MAGREGTPHDGLCLSRRCSLVPRWRGAHAAAPTDRPDDWIRRNAPDCGSHPVAALPADTPSADRRFELSTLKRVLPIFGLYLLLAALWPPLRPLVVWHGMFGLTSRAQDTSLQFIFPRVEYLAALTVLGYLTAEWRGRAEAPLRQDLPRLLLAAAGTALFLEALVGFQAGSGASLVRAVLVTFSALFGGVIYHLLRDHIRFLLRR